MTENEGAPRYEPYEGDWVEVESGFDPDTAVLLLDAAEQLDMPVEYVRTTSVGFIVPVEVADAAGVDYGASPGVQSQSVDEDISFSSRTEAQQYADEHNITIDGGEQMNAADYKAAVAAAAKGA